MGEDATAVAYRSYRSTDIAGHARARAAAASTYVHRAMVCTVRDDWTLASGRLSGCACVSFSGISSPTREVLPATTVQMAPANLMIVNQSDPPARTPLVSRRRWSTISHCTVTKGTVEIGCAVVQYRAALFCFVLHHSVPFGPDPFFLAHVHVVSCHAPTGVTDE